MGRPAVIPDGLPVDHELSVILHFLVVDAGFQNRLGSYQLKDRARRHRILISIGIKNSILFIDYFPVLLQRVGIKGRRGRQCKDFTCFCIEHHCGTGKIRDQIIGFLLQIGVKRQRYIRSPLILFLRIAM